MVQVVWRRWRPGGGHRFESYGRPGFDPAGSRPRARPSASALILRKDAAGERLYAAHDFRVGERVLELAEVTWRAERDRETVEHPFGGHLHHPILAKAAHCCEPNCRIDFSARVLLATQPIAAGALITTDYQSTDRRISQPFDCRCGARRCRGRIG